ncbi:hypothetical protein F909_00174 [Acinetobacter sp. ANC 3929]|uniref:hypothetical protein n=1 Tax=unclassified Acinetobacter TaxID=196816 RepID=UPI0002D0F6D8|nr:MULTISPECIES: hypothetical protein [unclassified Acinetobacter]ENW84267.1 hypothetical protein F909_00174 [Acinetobacter sp. ANC 3929]MCH7352379.1 hypothetical protein [Acinetobacter sp. NIPH 2023]MCH7355864.1 hypothetical protein [Acinetobacter sp. NIPH 1958]MCH7359772.1 hypothetical protein [Acinetobacter sp. NIPH 2024]
MALDQIWKQQLTLVTYGNEFLAGGLHFSRWVEHPIFNQKSLIFRDLLSQHLLAQHFQVWLEGLKKQGVNKLSLHLSSLLSDEQNPNANVELLPFTHFIVSHQANKKTAWICGHELPEWYNSDKEFEAPVSQQSSLREETFWRYELNDKFSKKINTDLQKLNWNDVASFLERELFDSKYAEYFSEPEQQDLPFYGYNIDPTVLSEQQLALIPTDYPADCAHSLLHRTQALTDYLEQQRLHPYNASGELISPEEQINLRNFSQKTDDLFAKLIVKTANHYQTAQLTAAEPEIIDRTMEVPQHQLDKTQHHKVGASGVIKLIILTVIICLVAYYFGL